MIQFLQGDCRDILPTLPAESVQCCVTSPPYWGLRDYGTASWEGGNAGCDHIIDHSVVKPMLDGRGKIGTSCTSWTTRADRGGKRVCNCGARRIDSQIGLESTPEEYIASMVAVFREVWRVLRHDGTLWVNCGDSYSSGNSGQRVRDSNGGFQPGLNTMTQANTKANPGRPPVTGMKPKDLLMMPARLAMALQADGWYLRSEIVWAKPNPMPESVTDRPTKSHEMIYLLAKQERYFYDTDAIKEDSSKMDGAISVRTWQYEDGSSNPHGGGFRGEGGLANRISNGLRNKRSVWTVATQPYSEAHFATFPEDLIKPCILAGSRAGDTVLDPFAGSGTTGQVAIELGRKAILIELNPAYMELAQDRTNVTAGFF